MIRKLLQAILVVLGIVSLVAFLMGCDKKNPMTGPTPTTCEDANATNRGGPLPCTYTEFFIGFNNAEPAPMPKGSPYANCGLSRAIEGTIVAKIFVHPGGTEIQMYLGRLSDLTTIFCDPKVPVCPGAIDPVTFTTSSVEKSWLAPPIGPDKYCVAFRNRTETKQLINGSVNFVY